MLSYEQDLFLQFYQQKQDKNINGKQVTRVLPGWNEIKEGLIFALLVDTGKYKQEKL